MDREPALAAVLPRQPGTKEARYAHLLSGPVESIQIVSVETASGRIRAAGDGSVQERFERLEAAVDELRQQSGGPEPEDRQSLRLRAPPSYCPI